MGASVKRNLLIISFILLLVTSFSCKASEFVQKIFYENPINYRGQAVDIDVDFSQDKIRESRVLVQIYVDTQMLEPYDSNTCSFESYLSAQENNYYQRNLQVFNSLNLTGYESYYICKYAPIIDVEYLEDSFSTAQVSSINSLNTTNNNISCVYIKRYTEGEAVGQITSAVKESMLNMQTEYTDRSVTGDGVKVGILEAGQVNKKDSAFKDGQVTVKYKFHLGSLVEEHTTNMAKIIAGSDGLAPDATIYNAFLSGSPDDEIEWLLDKGVDIINMSYSDSETPNGKYNSDTAYIDYIAKEYKVLIVAAAGNYGSLTAGYVSNPGLGYNVLTVGAVNQYKARMIYSSFCEEDGPYKPNLVAMCGISFPGELTDIAGTSVSCALTTGLVACLFEKHRELKGNPQRTIALLMANAERIRPELASYSLYNGMDDEYGVGKVDYKESSRMIYGSNNIPHTSFVSNGDTYYNIYNLFPGESIDVCLVSFTNADGKVSHRDFTDFDIILSRFDNKQVVASRSSSSNIEYLHYTNDTGEQFIIEVTVVMDGYQKYDNEILGFAERTKTEPY